jgi:hypothetical protein
MNSKSLFEFTINKNAIAVKQLYMRVDNLKRRPTAKTLYFLCLKKLVTMKKNKKNIIETQGKVQAAGSKVHNRVIYSSEPVPLSLLEKPNDARAKQWENTDMPSDFWL